MRVRLTDDELQLAEDLAEARLNEQRRRQSPDRPTSRTPEAQRRGAVGEIAAAKFLRSEGFDVTTGFEQDAQRDSDPDISIRAGHGGVKDAAGAPPPGTMLIWKSMPSEAKEHLPGEHYRDSV